MNSLHLSKNNRKQRCASRNAQKQKSEGFKDKHVGARAGTPLFLQRSPITSNNSDTLIQRQSAEEEEQGFQYSILPPSLSYRYGPFSASADTSAAQLGYRSRTGSYNLGYQYGGNLFAGANVSGFQGRLGVNPTGGNVSLGGSYSGFNIGLSGAPSGQFGARFGYGAPLLPMPAVLGEQAGAAWQGAYSLGGAIPEFGANPLAAYSAHSSDIEGVKTFAGSASQVYQQQQGGGGLPFGVGAGLAYDPSTGVIFNIGAQGHF